MGSRAAPATRGWIVTLDGVIHRIELGPMRVLRRQAVFLDDRLVGGVPRVYWTRVSVPFRIGVHELILDAGVRQQAAGDEVERVYGLRVDGEPIGPPSSVHGRADRPALAGSPQLHPRRQIVTAAVATLVAGLVIGVAVPAALEMGARRAASLEGLLMIVGAVTLIGAPIAVIDLVRSRRWGWAQQAFLQYGAPLMLGVVVGGRLQPALPLDAEERGVALAMTLLFAAMGLAGLVAGLRMVVARRDPSAGAERLSIAFAIGIVLFSLGILGFVAMGVTATLDLAGASMHDAGPAMTPIILGSVGLMLVAAVPLMIGRPKRGEPDPNLG